MTAVARNAQRVLKLDELALPEKPRVLRIAVDDYADSAGEDALRVDVLLDEATTDDELLSQGERIKVAIFDRLKAEGIDEFPYVFLAKPSELEDVEDED